ncbi:hypothetical protein BDY24DRAFT_414478 [Mrakia frigida]|uniref:uncharacterized protein n=1 Tax=Mrakia frigida TaxID=29902 RepID=UPI003FCBF6B8
MLHPSPFSPEELALSLSEDINQGLINSFSLQCMPQGETADDARASLTLLEGTEVDIRLTVLPPASTDGPSPPPSILHETLSNLLSSISPLYAEKWNQTLFSKLLDPSPF